jgi:phenylpropionate dioxygenase-like ring-hydroxylating dioxygenase large terminal subunit
MGGLMRQYWVPALRSTELPKPDGDPVRVMLFGEKLIAFRDSSGRVGLIADACPHRGASLFFGRNEECGIRCVYHGWKFDVSGQCVEMPNEPPASNFKDKVRARTYPCVERGGNIVWTYMGERDTPPPMPHFEVLDYPDEDIMNLTFHYRCNWVQAMEGNNDMTHASFLHAGHQHWQDMDPNKILRAATYDRSPGHKLLDIEAGVLSAASFRDPDREDHTYWGITHWMFPFYSLVPTGPLGKKVAFIATVPMDDDHTLQFVATLRLHRLVFADREYSGEQLQPNGTGWYDRFRWKHVTQQDYGLDRDRQRRGESYTGLDGNIIEDVAITENMGPIVDRTKEHLGAADVEIIRIRRRLIAAATALAENGTTPPGVDDPYAYRVRGGGVSLPTGVDWLEGTEELRAVPDDPMALADAAPSATPA